MGRRFSTNPGGGSRSRGPAIRRRWKGLLSPKKLVNGDCGMDSAPMGGGIVIRGVREVFEGLVSK